MFPQIAKKNTGIIPNQIGLETMLDLGSDPDDWGRRDNSFPNYPQHGARKDNFDSFNQVETTVTLDTTLHQYERDGGDAQFIKDVTQSIRVDASQARILQKRQGSVILTFAVRS